jgi:hypothetical protein
VKRRDAEEVGAGLSGAGEQRLDPRHDPALLGQGREGDPAPWGALGLK